MTETEEKTLEEHPLTKEEIVARADALEEIANLIKEEYKIHIQDADNIHTKTKYEKFLNGIKDFEERVRDESLDKLKNLQDQVEKFQQLTVPKIIEIMKRHCWYTWGSDKTTVENYQTYLVCMPFLGWYSVPNATYAAYQESIRRVSLESHIERVQKIITEMKTARETHFPPKFVDKDGGGVRDSAEALHMEQLELEKKCAEGFKALPANEEDLMENGILTKEGRKKLEKIVDCKLPQPQFLDEEYPPDAAKWVKFAKEKLSFTGDYRNTLAVVIIIIILFIALV